ncbi:hypothetical protein Vretifemale_19859, partial [Volvox reticuliferus]
VKYVESASTTGAASRSFTSTALQPATRNERARTRLQRTPTKKGYVRLHTNLGDLNVELHCDLAPRTCENFLALCDMGYYDGTVFHRSIKNFMIQGPTLDAAANDLGTEMERRTPTVAVTTVRTDRGHGVRGASGSCNPRGSSGAGQSSDPARG